MSRRVPETGRQDSIEATEGLVIRLLGPMEVRVGGDAIPQLRTRKGLWLLALLALRANRDVDRAWLAGMIWPDYEEADARRSLRQSLHDLRTALGSESWRLRSASRRVVRLDIAEDNVDVLVFERLAAIGDTPSLRQCTDLYRGPLVEGCAEEWVVEERRRMEKLFVSVLERLADQMSESGDHAAAATHLGRAVTAEPFREDLRRAWMMALARGGDAVSATHVYRELRSLLHSELRAEPSAETTALYHEIRAGLRSEWTPPAGQRKPRTDESTDDVARRISHTIPRPLTGLIGRAESVSEIGRLLSRHRLVTLTGSGGIGKTRLGSHVADELASQFGQGSAFVSLAAISDPGSVADAIRDSLGISPGAVAETPTYTLRSYLSSRNMLMVLDNCEHVCTAAARLVETLLESCPNLRILATSRQRLGLAGEAVCRVPSLAVPPPVPDAPGQNPVEGAPPAESYAAVRLFVERATAVNPGFELDSHTLPVVVEICRRLDGIPLAIELAAARTRSLPVDYIWSRLSSGFALIAGSEAIVSRHRTLESAFRWSWDLLTNSERRVLERLSVFAGVWTLEDAEAVCRGDGVEADEIAEIVASLVDQSLVSFASSHRLSPDVAPGTGQYRLLETIRQFAIDRRKESGEDRLIRARHVAHFLQLAEDAEPQLTGEEQQMWFERLACQHDNFREALSWCCANETLVDEGFRLAGALWRFWDVRGHAHEGRRWFTSLLCAESGRTDPAARAKALYGAGQLAFRCTDFAAATSLQEECLAIRRALGDQHGIAAALNGLGNAASMRCDYTSARACYGQSLAISRALGDRRSIGLALNNLANHAIDRTDYAEAKTLLRENLTIRRELGDQRGLAIALNNLALASLGECDYETAKSLHNECLVIERSLGNRRGAAVVLSNLGIDSLRMQDYATAQPLFAESLAILWELGDKSSAASTLEAMACTRSALGEHIEAARLWGAADRLREELGAPQTQDEFAADLGLIATARASAGETAFDNAWAEGRAMDSGAAVAVALSHPAD